MDKTYVLKLNMDKTYVLESVKHGQNICIREC